MGDEAEQLYERVLVLRCQAGDPAAFEELVGRYGPRLRYYLRKLLGGPDGAEDALQEVWCDAFRGLPRLLDPRALPAWLYRLARDRAFRQLRRRRPGFVSLPEAGLPDPAGDDGDFSAEDAARVHAALDRLAPEHREVLLLRFLEEMPYEDIARVAGCPVGTVRSRLHYAKHALRQILEKEGDGEREGPGAGAPEAGRGRAGGRP
jgi:RNA polymerase sigma-70 factor (ECF subfamily)